MAHVHRKPKYSRRAFLASVGLGAAAVPLLEAEDALGGCLANPPKRVVFIVFPNGCDGNSKAGYARGSDQGVMLPDWMGQSAGTGVPSLVDLRSELVVFDGFHNSQSNNGSHETRPEVFTAEPLAVNDGHSNHRVVAGGPSIDQVIAKQLAAQGVKTPRPVLNLQVRGGDGYRASWRGKADPAQPERDPFRLTGQLFAGLSLSPKDDAAAAKLWQARKLVLDQRRRELEAFRTTLGKPDQIIVESWMASLAELQQELMSPPVLTGCTPPELGSPFDVSKTENHAKILKAHFDLTAAALAADVTRVALLEIDNSWGDSTIMAWLGAGFEYDGAKQDTATGNNHHHIAHENGPRKTKIDAWYHGQLAYFIDRLGKHKEGTGSLLDNTLVVFTSDGRNGAAHSTSKVPWIVAGGKAMGVRRNRYVAVGDAPKQQLLLAVAQTIGADVKEFGGKTVSALR